MTIEIVDFPINSMVFFNSYVKLPEGRYEGSWIERQCFCFRQKDGFGRSQMMSKAHDVVIDML